MDDGFTYEQALLQKTERLEELREARVPKLRRDMVGLASHGLNSICHTA